MLNNEWIINGGEPKDVKMIVAGTNAGGEPDFYFVKVRCTWENFSNGDHYDIAKQLALDEGYERPFVPFDEQDDAGNAILDKFEWDTASVYDASLKAFVEIAGSKL